MPDDVTGEIKIEEVETLPKGEEGKSGPDPPWMDRLLKRLAGLVTPTQELGDGGKGTDEPPKAVPLPEADSSPVEEIPPTDPVGAALEKRLSALEKSYTNQIAALQKAHEGQVRDIAARLEKAEERANEADQRVARQEWLQKAEEMTLALNVKPDDLAAHLFTIAQELPGEAEWLEGVFKSLDHQLTEAGLFGEIGTTLSPQEVELSDKVAGIAKEQNVPYEEALLQLSPAEQEQLLTEMRKGAKDG